MTGQPTLKDQGARTIIGVYSRVAGRLLTLAFAFGIWHKWLVGQPNKRACAFGEFQLAEKGELGRPVQTCAQPSWSVSFVSTSN